MFAAIKAWWTRDGIAELRARIAELEGENARAQETLRLAHRHLDEGNAARKAANETMSKAQALAREVAKDAKAGAVLAAVELLGKAMSAKDVTPEMERMRALADMQQQALGMMHAPMQRGLGGLYGSLWPH